MLYARLTDITGTVTPRLAILLPNIINPTALTDDELTARGIARVEIVREPLQWWQTYAAPIVDADVRPITITYAAIDRDLESVKAMAWERIKEIRAEKRGDGVEHAFPGGVGYIQIREEDINNLLSIHAAATTAMMMQQSAAIPFTDRENTTHWLTAAQALGVAMAAFSHGAAVHVTSQTVRGAIDQAQTVTAVVDATAWPEG